MSVAHATTNNTVALPVGRLVRDGAVAAVVAAVGASVVAAAGQAAGVSLEVNGGPIPVPGFATAAIVFSVLGLVIAVVLRRFAGRPRTVWIRTTVTLTALSFVPDLLVDAATATKVLLMVTHLVAAAIVIPAVARRLRA